LNTKLHGLFGNDEGLGNHPKQKEGQSLLREFLMEDVTLKYSALTDLWRQKLITRHGDSDGDKASKKLKKDENSKNSGKDVKDGKDKKDGKKDKKVGKDKKDKKDDGDESELNDVHSNSQEGGEGDKDEDEKLELGENGSPSLTWASRLETESPYSFITATFKKLSRESLWKELVKRGFSKRTRDYLDTENIAGDVFVKFTESELAPHIGSGDAKRWVIMIEGKQRSNRDKC
jgi:hypothetical protein